MSQFICYQLKYIVTQKIYFPKPQQHHQCVNICQIISFVSCKPRYFFISPPEKPKACVSLLRGLSCSETCVSFTNHNSYPAQGESVEMKKGECGNYCKLLWGGNCYDIYHKTSSISRTKSQNLNVSHLVLQLSLPNPLKPNVKLIMKM